MHRNKLFFENNTYEAMQIPAGTEMVVFGFYCLCNPNISNKAISFSDIQTYIQNLTFALSQYRGSSSYPKVKKTE